MVQPLTRIPTCIRLAMDCSRSELALLSAQLGEVVGVIAIGTAAVTSPSTTTITSTETTLTISTEARAIDLVKAAAEIGRTTHHTGAARPTVIGELLTSLADALANNLPAERAIVPAEDKDSLAETVQAAEPELGILVEETSEEEIDPVAAAEISPATGPVAEQALPIDQLSATRSEVVEARALRLDLRAAVHLAVAIA